MEPGRAVRITKWLLAGALACWALSITLLAAARILPAAAGGWTPPGRLLQALRGVETGLGAAAVIVCTLAAVSLATLAAVIVKKRRERQPRD